MVTRRRKLFKTLLLTCVLVLLFSSTIVFALPSPTSAFYVNDFANVLDSNTKGHIEASAAQLENLTSAQVVVVTVNDLEDQSLEEYSLELFRTWEIGDADKNNGVLILLDLGGRQTRIEVGYGLEGAIPDGKAGRIQDIAMIPHFQQGDYSTGIREGFNAIVNEIYLEYGLSSNQIGNPLPIDNPYGSTTQEQGIPPIIIIIGLFIAIPLIILDFKVTGGVITYGILRSLSRGSSRGGGRGGYGGGGRSGGGGRAGGGGSSRRF